MPISSSETDVDCVAAKSESHFDFVISSLNPYSLLLFIIIVRNQTETKLAIEILETQCRWQNWSFANQWYDCDDCHHWPFSLVSNQLCPQYLWSWRSNKFNLSCINNAVQWNFNIKFNITIPFDYLSYFYSTKKLTAWNQDKWIFISLTNHC